MIDMFKLNFLGVELEVGEDLKRKRCLSRLEDRDVGGKIDGKLWPFATVVAVYCRGIPTSTLFRYGKEAGVCMMK